MHETVRHMGGLGRTVSAKRELNELCRDLVTQEIEMGRLKRPSSIRRLRRWVAKQVMHRVGLRGENLKIRWRQAALAAIIMSGMLLYTGTEAKAAISFEDRSSVAWDPVARTGNPLKDVINTNYQPASPVFADIDKDGDLDAFIGTVEYAGTYPFGGYVGVIKYFRNESGVFSEQTTTWNSSAKTGNPFLGLTFGSGSPPFLAFADIDGDGDLDAFIGNSYGTIKYYVNDGNGLFTEKNGAWDSSTKEGNPLNNSIVVDIYFSAPAFADIDGDGDLDAFIGNSNGDIRYYVNVDGAGLFSEQTGTWDPIAKTGNPLYIVNTNYYRTFPAFADIDNDGDLDAFIGTSLDTGTYSYGVIKYYKNDAGVFSEQTGAWNSSTKVGNLLASVAVDGYCCAPAFADLDRDGDLDVFIGDSGTKISYFQNMNHPGDIGNDGSVTSADALKALRIAAGLDTATADDLVAGDVAPLVNGITHPDGKIDLGDVVVILRLAVGL